MLDVEFVDALDREVVVLAAHRRRRTVQRHVAGRGDHIVEAEIRLANRRQDADQDRPEAQPFRGRVALRVELLHLRFHHRDAIAREVLRVGIELQLEESKLRCEVRILKCFEHLQ